MPEDSTTPDLVELTRRSFEAANRHDVDAIMGFHAPEAVWDLSDMGIGSFERASAIRGFIEDWFGTWGDHQIAAEEIVDLGHGTVFARVREVGRLAGSDGHVEQRRGWVLLWFHGKVERLEAYLDIDEARAAAERLAESRG
jgi:ketosteroid isomerase-like protein